MQYRTENPQILPPKTSKHPYTLSLRNSFPTRHILTYYPNIFEEKKSALFLASEIQNILITSDLPLTPTFTRSLL